MAENRYSDRVLEFVIERLQEFQQDGEIETDIAIGPEVRLIGSDAVLDSRSLVELLLGVEEFVEDELDGTFDWASDSAMSAKRSPFRNPTALAEFAASEDGGE